MSICLKNQNFLAFNNKGCVHSLDSPDTTDIPIDDQTSHVWLAQAKWCLSDNHDNNNADMTHVNKTKLQPQQQAVRLLLTRLLNTLGLVNVRTAAGTTLTVVLDETSYPYRLKPFNGYVSFSHSQHNVACALSRHSPIGIDLETRTIPLSVAKRFFHPLELAWLNALQPSERPNAIQILWSIKEAFIKKNSFDNLIIGLKVNHVDIARRFIQQLRQQQYLQPLQQAASTATCNSLPSNKSICPFTAFIEQSAQHWWLCIDRDDTCLIVVKDTN